MAAGISSSSRTSCSVRITGIAAPTSGKIQMSAKAKHSARLRIQHNQIAGCIGSKVSCGLYRRKPVSQRIDHLAMAVFAPHLEPYWRTAQREHMPGGSGKREQMRSLWRIRRFESCGLHAITAELQNPSVNIADVHGAAGIRHSGKWMRRLFRGVRQNSPNLKENSPAIKHLDPSTRRVRDINSSLSVSAKGKRALEITLGSDTHQAQWIALWKEQVNYSGTQVRNVDGPSGIHRNGIRGTRDGIFEAEQVYSGGLKLLHETGRAVGKVHPADGIHGGADRILKLARLRAANSPLLHEFDRWKPYRGRGLRMGARATLQC